MPDARSGWRTVPPSSVGRPGYDMSVRDRQQRWSSSVRRNASGDWGSRLVVSLLVNAVASVPPRGTSAALAPDGVAEGAAAHAAVSSPIAKPNFAWSRVPPNRSAIPDVAPAVRASKYRSRWEARVSLGSHTRHAPRPVRRVPRPTPRRPVGHVRPRRDREGATGRRNREWTAVGTGRRAPAARCLASVHTRQT